MKPWGKQGLGQLPAQDGAVRPPCPLCRSAPARSQWHPAQRAPPGAGAGPGAARVPPWPWVFAPQQRFWCRSHSGDTTTGNTRGQTAQHQNGERGEGAAAGSLGPPAPDSPLPRKMGYFIAGGAASASKHQILGGWDPPCLVRTQPPAPAVGRSRSGSTGSTRAPPRPHIRARTPPHTLLAAPQEDGGPSSKAVGCPSPPNPAAVSAEPVAQSHSGAQGLAGRMRNAPGRRGQSLCWPPAPNPGLLEHQTPASSESRARRQPSARPAGRKQMPRARSRRFPSLSGGA